MAFASCSQLPEHGYFTAYRRLAEDHPDLVLHLGDYLYEGAGRDQPGWAAAHAGPETVTLANYRQRHAQYKTDPDLQAAHAVAPWLVVCDDHEVENNYADEMPEKPADGGRLPRAAGGGVPGLLREHAAATGLGARAAPTCSCYRRVSLGRAWRPSTCSTPGSTATDQACGDGYDDCPDAADPARSLPGAGQEELAARRVRRSHTRWDILGQQVFFGRARQRRRTGEHGLDGLVGRVPRLPGPGGRGLGRRARAEPGRAHRRRARALGLRRAGGLERPRAPAYVGSELVTTRSSSGGDGTTRRPASTRGRPGTRTWVLDEPARLRADHDHPRPAYRGLSAACPAVTTP